MAKNLWGQFKNVGHPIRHPYLHQVVLILLANLETLDNINNETAWIVNLIINDKVTILKSSIPD